MNTDLRWWMPPLFALQFLTRIPVPGLEALSAETARAGLARAVIWFPLVGALVGAVTATVVMVADHFWPRAVAVLLALMVEARLTGAFHEDAVADFCDGFGGGQTAARRIDIMKDSRIGSYGTLGLILAVGLRAACLMALPATLLLAGSIASAAAGRWGAVLAMALIPPVDQAQSLAKDIGRQASVSALLQASLLLLPCLALFVRQAPFAALLALGAQLLAFVWFRVFLLKRLGGVTGDCLGFYVYLSQLIWLLAVLAWPG